MAHFIKRSLLPVLLVILILTGCGKKSNSSPFYIEALADTSVATIGDVVSFQVWAHGSGERKIEFLPWQIDTTKIQIRSIEDISNEYRDDFGLEYELAVWDTGRIEFPPHSVKITSREDTTGFTMRTDPVFIKVSSVLPVSGQAGLRPIKGPVSVRIPFPWRSIILIGILVMLILALVIIMKKRQTSSIQEEIKIIPTEPPDRIALNKINDLIENRAWENGQFKELYFDISYILREYLENSLYIKTLEMTTSEIISVRDELAIDDSLFISFINVLTRSDMIKFARQVPAPEECRADLDSARQFVMDTVSVWNLIKISNLSDSKFESTPA